MLKFRAWKAHNSRVISDIETKRANRPNGKVGAPISLAKVIVSADLDQQFAAFARAVGPRQAETFFLRALQYAAHHDGREGAIMVEPGVFGTIVLSRPWDVVSPRDGVKCYNALLASTICVPVHGDAEGAPSGAPYGDDAATPREPTRLPHPAPSPSPAPLPAPDVLPPTPSGGSGSFEASPLTSSERDGIDAGCRAIHADPKASAALKARAAAVFNGLREGMDPDEARAFFKREIATNTNYRCAAYAAKGS